MQDIDGTSNEKKLIKSGLSLAKEIIKLVAFLGGLASPPHARVPASFVKTGTRVVRAARGPHRSCVTANCIGGEAMASWASTSRISREPAS